LDPIEIFRTGRHTAMAGQTLTFGEAELTAMVAAYDPAIYKAPIVLGHPETDHPAWGWVSDLAAANDRVTARVDQVDPAFAEGVRAGRYRYVSASFWTPASTNNPKPGAYYLRHVGFLGAVPPAVKGLKPVTFAAADEGVVEFAMASPAGIFADVLRRMREFFIGREGQEIADRIVPSYQIEALTEHAAMERVAEPASTFSDPPNPQETPTVTDAERAAEARAAAAEAEVARLREQAASFAEREAQARTAEDAAFLERLQAEGRMLPANRPLAAGMLARLAAGEAISFAEGRPGSAWMWRWPASRM
jgi:hypothetical protein